MTTNMSIDELFGHKPPVRMHTCRCGREYVFDEGRDRKYACEDCVATAGLWNAFMGRR